MEDMHTLDAHPSTPNGRLDSAQFRKGGGRMDPDRSTHGCSACSSGSPCGDCGGNIDRSSPAYKALEWGWWSSAKADDPFWKVAVAANAVRTAPDNDES